MYSVNGIVDFLRSQSKIIFLSNVSGVRSKRLSIQVLWLVTSEFILYWRDIGVPPLKNMYM